MLVKKLPRSLKFLPHVGRVSNLPTVISNIIAGYFLSQRPIDITLLYLILSGSLLYIFGMALNDLLDFSQDKKEKKLRPLVKKQVLPKDVLHIIIGSLFLGVFFSILGNANYFVLLSLIISIILYNLFHKKIGQALIFMGINRALLILLPALLISKESIIYSSIVFLYTCYLTSFAKRENKNKMEITEYIYLIPFIALGFWFFGIQFSLILFLIFIITYFLKVRSVKWSIYFLIAGFCLLDALLVLSSSPLFGAGMVLLFINTLINQRFIAGT